VTEDQLVKPEALDREARRLEKLRSLRLVQESPDDDSVAPVEIEYEPKDAA
jgi:hypothetical protein